MAKNRNNKISKILAKKKSTEDQIRELKALNEKMANKSHDETLTTHISSLIRKFKNS
jgi:hypothetical protein